MRPKYFEGYHVIKALDFSRLSGLLNILMPFGVPLTSLDALQLLLPRYEALTHGEQGELGDIEIEGDPLFIDLDNFQNKLESLQERLGDKPFIDAHKQAHQHLITKLRESTKTSSKTKGAIRVLEKFNTEAFRKKS